RGSTAAHADGGRGAARRAAAEGARPGARAPRRPGAGRDRRDAAAPGPGDRHGGKKNASADRAPPDAWQQEEHVKRLQERCRAARPAALSLLAELGPATSLATLHAAVPTLGRNELDDLVRRYRRVWRRRYQQALHVLTWTTPGTVWAAEFAQAPQAIDGLFP